MNRWRTTDRAYCDSSNGEFKMEPGKRTQVCPQCGREITLRRLGKTEYGRLPWHKKVANG